MTAMLRGWLALLRPGERNWPFSAHLVLLALAIMLPLLAFAGFSLQNYIAAERRGLYNKTQRLADGVATNLEREMASTMSLLNVLAQDTAFDRGEYFNLYTRAREGLRGQRGNVALFARDDKPIFHTSFPFGTDLPATPGDGSWREVLQTGQARVSNLFFGRLGQRQLVAVIVPILRKGTAIGRLQLALEPGDLASLVAPWSLMPRQDFAIADRALRYVVSSNPAHAAVAAPLQAETASQLTADSGQFRGFNHSGEAVLTAYRRSPVVGWVAFATVPLALVEQPLIRVWRDFALAGTAALALSLLAAYAFSRAMARPLERLAQSALGFGEGRDVASFRSQLREANLLASAFSEASQQLKGRTLALAESERRFRLFAERTPDVIWFLNLETRRFDYISPGFFAIWRRPPEEVATLDLWRNTVHPQDLFTFDQGLTEGESDNVQSEYRITRPDGGVRWVRDVRFPLPLSSGRPGVLAGILRDVTARKEAVDALMAAQAEAEARLKELENLYRSAPIGLALIDTDFRFVRMNEFLARMSEKAEGDPAGRSFFEIFPELEASTRPLCEELLRTGQAVKGVELDYDKQDGRGQQSLLTHLYPISGENGSVSGIGVIIESTTDRKRAEQTMARLAAIVYAATDAMFSFAPTGRIQNWNPAAQTLFHYTPEEAIGQRFSMLFFEKGNSDYQRLLTAWQAGESLRLDTEMCRKGGDSVPVSISIAPIKEGDRVVAISTTIEDITERRRWEKRQLLMNRELSHRVKNSLAVIQAMARHTLRSSPTPAAFTAAFEGRLRALATSHNLLTSSAWEGADLEELAREQLAPHSAGAGRLQLRGPSMTVPPGIVTSLGLVLHELGTNAAKYGALSAPGGSVALTWEVVEASPHRMLVLEWTERGGPPVQQPERKGFGSVLIENSGKVEQHFEPEGLRCIVKMPLMDEPEAKPF